MFMIMSTMSPSLSPRIFLMVLGTVILFLLIIRAVKRFPFNVNRVSMGISHDLRLAFNGKRKTLCV